MTLVGGFPKGLGWCPGATRVGKDDAGGVILHPVWAWPKISVVMGDVYLHSPHPMGFSALALHVPSPHRESGTQDWGQPCTAPTPSPTSAPPPAPGECTHLGF